MELRNKTRQINGKKLTMYAGHSYYATFNPLTNATSVYEKPLCGGRDRYVMYVDGNCGFAARVW